MSDASYWSWEISGYVPPSIFPGASRCAFRLAHVREDGLAVVTLGDYRERGRLEPLSIMPGFSFVTTVARLPEEDGQEATVLEKAAAQDWRAATAQHKAMLEAWANRKVSKP